MKTKVLGMLTILSLLATGNVLAGDHRHNNHADLKRKDVRIVVKNPHLTRRAVTTYQQGGKHHKHKVVTTKVRHKHRNNSDDRLGFLIGGVILGSVLSGH